MERYFLCFKLLSDAAFCRGDGLAGEVDSEIQHDELGCPFLSGRSLKGILVNECADIIVSLPADKQDRWINTARCLFGQPGQLDSEAAVKISDAHIPQDLRHALQHDLDQRLKILESEAGKSAERAKFKEEVLHLLTAVRAQTALDVDGVAKKHSLRSRRIIVRNIYFEADLFLGQSTGCERDDALMLLDACVAAFRRAGSNRNRGLGKLRAWLETESRVKVTKIDSFINEVMK